MTVFGISRALTASRDTTRKNLVREIQTGIASYQGLYRRIPDKLVKISNTEVELQDTTGAKKVAIPVDMNIVLNYTKESDMLSYSMKTDEAVVCFKTVTSAGSGTSSSSDGYSLGVRLEAGDPPIYYLTTDTCN
jgi:hypothetical protein